ncbi:hypothetical protein TraAM80_06357 [Trypanosoma rangeli]|uniref:Uncharacterized protein n=1 Tax=Trypanosoma rangeli TaxID=5698 RepID=A0A422NAH4_TRYRA|nr:uncharacterized protein TraAM80_06357 [Trypanosoma rangeli]RNF02451.1 hypothetical protein TraAM80_06357 [Trypanosoma rangeli]|eukprot:RNF02451.1 hypothetical protein TraAM80_06357 [Trypanosoma rangeli]
MSKTMMGSRPVTAPLFMAETTEPSGIMTIRNTQPYEEQRRRLLEIVDKPTLTEIAREKMMQAMIDVVMREGSSEDVVQMITAPTPLLISMQTPEPAVVSLELSDILTIQIRTDLCVVTYTFSGTTWQDPEEMILVFESNWVPMPLNNEAQRASIWRDVLFNTLHAAPTAFMRDGS